MGSAVTATPAHAAGGPRGHDGSSHQKSVDWRRAKNRGARFVYVKATESHTYKNPYFRQQYNRSRSAGIIRGAYHFALPHKSSGRTQAAYFVRNGGTGRHRGFAADHALWLPRYGSSPGPLPAGWSYPAFWQYADSGRLPGDQNLFNGSTAQLKRFARGR